MEVINRLGSIFIRQNYRITRPLGQYDDEYRKAMEFIKKYSRVVTVGQNEAVIFLKGKQIVGIARISLIPDNICLELDAVYEKIADREVTALYIDGGDEYYCIETYDIHVNIIVSLITDTNYEDDEDEVRDFISLIKYVPQHLVLLRPM